MSRRRKIITLGLTILIFAIMAVPSMGQPDTQLEHPINVVLVFDASGSMAATINGERKIDAARKAMEFVVANLPDDLPNLNVGFRIYGHEGDNTEAQRALSCQSTSLLVPVLGVDKAILRQQTYAWEPTGWTPITLALQEAGLDLAEVSAYQDCQGQTGARNVIIMVTDGEETCDADPCQAAQALAAADANTVIHVVGFGLTPDVATTLNCVPQNGGIYADASDGNSLATLLVDLIGQEIEAQGLEFVPLEISQFEFTPLELTEIEVTPMSVEGISVQPGGLNEEGTYEPPTFSTPNITLPSVNLPGVSQATAEPGGVEGGDVTPGGIDVQSRTATPAATATAVCVPPQR